MIIYKATNTINNKCYIGQTIQNLTYRRSAHYFYATKDVPDTLLSKAIKKYGRDAFTWEVLEQCDSKEQLDEMEYHYIKSFQSYGEGGYNSTPGAGGKGRRMTKEQKTKMSITTSMWWRETDPNGVEEIVHGMTKYAKDRGITKDRLIKLSLRKPGSTWKGYKCERLGKDYMNTQQINTLGAEIDTILNYTPPISQISQTTKWSNLTLTQPMTKWDIGLLYWLIIDKTPHLSRKLMIEYPNNSIYGSTHRG